MRYQSEVSLFSYLVWVKQDIFNFFVTGGKVCVHIFSNLPLNYNNYAHNFIKEQSKNKRKREQEEMSTIEKRKFVVKKY